MQRLFPQGWTGLIHKFSDFHEKYLLKRILKICDM